MGISSNRIELITKYSPKAWDKVYKQEAMSSMLDTNNARVEFTGAKTVRIGKWQNGGLHDYYRNNIGDDRVAYNGMAGVGENKIDGNAAGQINEFVGHPGFGYQRSATRFVWEEFTLKCDRAAAFQIEYFDNEESGEALITDGVKEISRTTIVPEVDAYTFSTIASYCSPALGNLVSYDLNGTDLKPLAELNKAFLYFSNNEVPIKDQLVFVSPNYMNALRQTNEVTKFLAQTDFDNKDISFTITKYEGRQLVEVAPERFRTDILLFGQEGYTWKETSRPINFLMVSKEAVTHVTKYDKVKVISGDLNLAGNGFDGYTIYARIYHDVFVPDNKRVGLYCCVNATDGYNGRTVECVSDASRKVTKLSYYPGDQIVTTFMAAATATAPKIGAAPASGFSVIDLGSTLPAATTNDVYVVAVQGGKVLASTVAIAKA